MKQSFSEIREIAKWCLIDSAISYDRIEAHGQVDLVDWIIEVNRIPQMIIVYCGRGFSICTELWKIAGFIGNMTEGMWMKTESAPLITKGHIHQPICWFDERPLHEIKPVTSFKVMSFHPIVVYDEQENQPSSSRHRCFSSHYNEKGSHAKLGSWSNHYLEDKTI